MLNATTRTGLATLTFSQMADERLVIEIIFICLTPSPAKSLAGRQRGWRGARSSNLARFLAISPPEISSEVTSMAVDRRVREWQRARSTAQTRLFE